VFKGLITDVKSAAASFVDTYLARASVAVPFLIALGLATAALGLELAERFGSRNALWMLAGGFCAIGLVASFVVTMKEQETEAAEEQQRNESGIGEMASTAATAATQAATQLPTALLSALLQSPSTSTLTPVTRLLGRNMPLVLLLVLVALLFSSEETAESADQQDDSAAGRPDGDKAPPDREPLRDAA
jgi:disulfide bond formation protein DsbB